MSHKAPYLYFLFFLFSQGKEGSLAHKFRGGGGEDNGMDQASFKKVSPCRKAGVVQESFALPESRRRSRKFRLAGKQASFKKVSPCRKANNRKAKLPKFEQS